MGYVDHIVVECRTLLSFQRGRHAVCMMRSTDTVLALVEQKAKELETRETWHTLQVVHPVRTFGRLARFLLIGCSVTLWITSGCNCPAGPNATSVYVYC